MVIDSTHETITEGVRGSGVALREAIRAFTVDLDEGQTPNGPAETALVDLLAALDPARWPDEERLWPLLRAANQAGVNFARASTVQTRDLRIAAEAFFGGDFRKT